VNLCFSPQLSIKWNFAPGHFNTRFELWSRPRPASRRNKSTIYSADVRDNARKPSAAGLRGHGRCGPDGLFASRSS
jgi:hypothetical protein